MSYWKSGRKDTDYIDKDGNGESQYRSCHYMLWALKEIVSMFNSEHDDQITYYTVQKILSEEKHW